MSRFAALSNGEIIANSRFVRESAAELAAANRSFARKQRGPKNRNRSRAKVAELHRRRRSRRSTSSTS